MALSLHAFALFALLALLAQSVVCEVYYDAIRSKRGVQPKQQWISDDFVVGCIMIMFLLLFCARPDLEPARRHAARAAPRHADRPSRRPSAQVSASSECPRARAASRVMRARSSCSPLVRWAVCTR